MFSGVGSRDLEISGRVPRPQCFVVQRSARDGQYRCAWVRNDGRSSPRGRPSPLLSSRDSLTGNDRPARSDVPIWRRAGIERQPKITLRSKTRALELKNTRIWLCRRVPTRTGVSGGLRAPIRPLMETIAVLRRASFQPTWSAAELSAFGDDFSSNFAYSLGRGRVGVSVRERISRCKIRKKLAPHGR